MPVYTVLGKSEALGKHPRRDLMHQADINLVAPLVGANGALGTRLTQFTEPQFLGANYAIPPEGITKRAGGQVWGGRAASRWGQGSAHARQYPLDRHRMPLAAGRSG